MDVKLTLVWYENKSFNINIELSKQHNLVEQNPREVRLES